MARIGIVIYSLAGAGAERVSVNLAQAFSARGHTVDFVLGQRQGELLGSIPADAGVYEGTAASAAGWRTAIRRYVQDRRPDVLLAMMEGAGVLALQAAGAVPVFVVSHIHYSRHYRRSARWKERYLMPCAVRWYFRKAAGVVGVSHGVSEDIRQSAWLKPDRVRTIYNPIITEEFKQRVSEPADHPWLATDRNWLTVVTVGRLTKQKDHETLMRAIRRVSDSRPVRVLILGQGEARERLWEQAQTLGIESRVEFLGFVANPYPYIAAADVFALSSAWEGFGNVLVEALAAGAAVVSTDCESGPREVLADGAFGQLVPVGDDRSLADAIDCAESNSVDQQALARHLKQFCAANVAEQYLRLMGLEPS
ncbi:group 1 glycosyl transferase [Salinisphaera shabanensis T35B1]|uniref:glycosyltransferase n=1 Tax=Salinisphaera shabanensis TaxID=180542 RepID=UPI0033408FEA